MITVYSIYISYRGKYNYKTIIYEAILHGDINRYTLRGQESLLTKNGYSKASSN